MDKTEGNKQLKSCPFCGSRARIFKSSNGFYGVECDKVGCVVMPAHYERSIIKVVNDWNKRA